MERRKKIQLIEEDIVLAVASNGLHTNGYSLVRMLMDMFPNIVSADVDGEKFIDLIMKPHTAYYPVIKDVLNSEWITGMAHITGGGINRQRSWVCKGFSIGC